MSNKWNICKKIISLVLMLAMGICVSLNAYATPNYMKEHPDYSELIIGEGENKTEKETRAGHIVYVSWIASASDIYINLTNQGTDSIFSCSGIITINDRAPIPFSVNNLLPFVKKTITVSAEMKECEENIEVEILVIDGVSSGLGIVSGDREIPYELSSVWNRGGYDSIYESIDYHFSKHGEEVNSANIVDYATKAYEYTAEIVEDMLVLPNTDFNNKYNVTISFGPTDSHKYLNRSNKLYAILTDDGYEIVSFGGKGQTAYVR